MQGLFHPAVRVWTFILGVKGIVTATAELVAALGAVKVHAASSGQCVRELALGAVNAILLEIHGQALGLVFWVIGAFPVLEILTAPASVLLLPLALTAHTEGLVTLGTRCLQLLPFIYEAKRALGTPQELGVPHEHTLSQLLVKQCIGIWLQTLPKLDVKGREVAEQLCVIGEAGPAQAGQSGVEDMFHPSGRACPGWPVRGRRHVSSEWTCVRPVNTTPICHLHVRVSNPKSGRRCRL